MGHISGFGSLSLECDLMWPLRTRLVPLLASFISKLKPGHSETEVRGTSLQKAQLQFQLELKSRLRNQTFDSQLHLKSVRAELKPVRRFHNPVDGLKSETETSE